MALRENALDLKPLTLDSLWRCWPCQPQIKDDYPPSAVDGEVAGCDVPMHKLFCPQPLELLDGVLTEGPEAGTPRGAAVTRAYAFGD
jgi:hypothetical protein